MLTTKRLILFFSLFAAALPAPAEQCGTGCVTIENAWTRALPPVSVNGAAYMTIINEGSRPDRLTGASSAIADRVEIHTHEYSGGMMSMRRLDGLDLPPDERVRFAPGGRHLMLIGLKQALEKDGRFTVRLEFTLAPSIDVEVPIKATGGDHAESHKH